MTVFMSRRHAYQAKRDHHFRGRHYAAWLPPVHSRASSRAKTHKHAGQNGMYAFLGVKFARKLSAAMTGRTDCCRVPWAWRSMDHQSVVAQNRLALQSTVDFGSRHLVRQPDFVILGVAA